MSKKLNLKRCKKVPNRDEYVCAGTKVPGKVYRKAVKKSATPSPKPKPDKPKPPKKPNKPKKPDGKDTSKPSVYFSSILPSRGLGKATLDRLTDDQVLRARGIQGSKIYHRQGKEALEEHLQKYLPGYKLDKVIDNAVLVSKDGKKGRIFVRGTAPENIKDILTDVNLMLGNLRNTKYYKDVKRLAQEAMEKYDKVDISGYSLGGGVSYGLGQELGIKSLTYNPLIGRNVISELGPQNIARNVAREFGLYGSPIDRSGRRIRTDHEIIRTTTDPASLLMGYSYLPANAKVDAIKGSSDTLNPIRWHDLDQFYHNIPKGIRYRNKTDAELKRAVEKHRIIVKKLGEKITLDRMQKSINAGKTLKEHMAMEDKADLDGMGKFGNRPVKQYYDLWRKAGGKLSQREADEIRSRGGSIKKKDIDKSLDEKTRKFMDEYSRSSLKDDIKKSAALLRRNKAKDGITSKNNEEKMLKQVEMSKSKDLKKLRTQFNERIKPQLPKEENRLKFTAPSELKRRAREKGREIKKQQAKAFEKEAIKLNRKAKRRLRKLKEKNAAKKAAKARREAEKQVKRLSRKKPIEKETFKKAFGKEKLKERGIVKKGRAANIEKKLMKGQNIRDSEELARERFERDGDLNLETKDEEPASKVENLGEETMGGILRNRTGIESNIPGPLTKDDEAKEFLKKTSAAKKEQLNKETKMAERSAKKINEKVKDDFKGSSFSVKDAIFDNIKGLGPSLLASYAVNGLFRAIDPDGKFTDTPAGELSEGLGIGLATGGVLKGLGHFLEAGDWAELGIGGAIGQLSSDEVGKLLYPALKKTGMSNIADSGITGAAQGATFAGTSLATGAALRGGYSALSGALSSGVESGEGVEMTTAAITGATETAETSAVAATTGAEIAETGGALAGAAAGAESGGAALSELGPAAVLAGILGGAVVGGLFGLIDAPKPLTLMQYAQKGASAKQIEKLAKQTGASYEQTEKALEYEQGQLQDRIKQILANKYGIHGPTTQIGLTAKQEKQITKQSPFSISPGLLAERAGLLPPEHPIPDRAPTIPVQTKK